MAACLLPVTVACGGGGDSGVVPGGGGSMTATFVPDIDSPGPNSSAMTLGGTSGELVTIVVSLRDVSNVYGAAFVVNYDSGRALFSGWAPGNVLETGSHSPTYQIDDALPGTLIVGATRNGNVPGINVSGSRALVRLTFRVLAEGLTALSFSEPELYDGGLPPQPLSGITWHAGALQAQ